MAVAANSSFQWFNLNVGLARGPLNAAIACPDYAATDTSRDRNRSLSRFVNAVSETADDL
jgi:hypothetical protein